MVIRFLQPGVEVRQLYSHIIHQRMQLYIKLPWGYERSDRTYPVLYCLDANRSFLLYSTLSLISETPVFDGPKILIVGIGYQVDKDRLKGLAQWAAWRMRDLTPERSEKMDADWQARLSPLMSGEDIRVQSGGANHFLRAIEEEIIPFIETNYRAAAWDRGLAGYADGGSFTLYTLFNATPLFERYFADSPTTSDKLFDDEAHYASKYSDMPARLLLTAARDEPDSLDFLRRMVACLQSRMYPGFEVLTHVFEDEGHSSAYAASVSQALRMLYYEVGRTD